MPIDDLTALGQKMREARKKKDLTQQELADLSHVSVKQMKIHIVLNCIFQILHLTNSQLSPL